MSRSRRHTPIMGIAGGRNEKWWKRRANRRLRRLARLIHDEDQVEPLLRETSDVWSSPKDGKHWFGGCEEMARWMRK
jgi:hypothetical protein